MAAEKDYAYVLGRTSSSSGYVTLNVLLMDGTASTLKLTKSDYDSLDSRATATLRLPMPTP